MGSCASSGRGVPGVSAADGESGLKRGICSPITGICCSRFRPSMRWRRWWDIGKGRVRFTSRGRMGAGSTILSASTFGHGGIVSRRSDAMRRRSGATCGTRRRRINGWSNWSCSRSKRRLGRAQGLTVPATLGGSGKITATALSGSRPQNLRLCRRMVIEKSVGHHSPRAATGAQCVPR